MSTVTDQLADLTARLEDLEKRPAAKPQADLQRQLEQQWLPDADTFLLPHSVGYDSIENIVLDPTIDIDPFGGGTGSTNWAAIANNGAQIKFGTFNSTGAQNAEIYWDKPVGIGTWVFTLVHITNNDAGQYAVTLDGASLGTIEGYSAALTNNVINTLSFTTSTASFKRLKLKMATKNAANVTANYYGRISVVSLRRTA